jgi:type I restriction enzyme S subunit
MGLNLGYKQNEVIPEDWQSLRIAQIGEVRGRVGWKGYTKKDLVSFGPLVIGAKHIDSECRLDLSDPTYLSPAKFLESPEIKIELYDLLIVQRGTIGKLVLIDRDIGDATINPSMVIVRLRKGSPSFVRYFLLSEAGQRQILSDTSSTGVPMISQRQIENFSILLPRSETEQCEIAKALSDADALIAALDRLIAKTRDLKQAAMQQLLTGQKRLPGFAPPTEKFKQTEVGVIPEDWNPDYIENFAHITTGSKNTQDRIKDGAYPFFVRSQIVERINSYSFDGEAVLTAGDGVGTGKVFHYINGKFDVHQRVYRISNFAENVNGYFFYLYFSSHFYSRIVQMTAKSSVDSVRRDMIARMLVPIPPTKAEQTAIAEVLSDMDAEIAALEQRRDKTRALKQGMMQELLTGRTRLV